MNEKNYEKNSNFFFNIKNLLIKKEIYFIIRF